MFWIPRAKGRKKVETDDDWYHEEGRYLQTLVQSNCIAWLYYKYLITPILLSHNSAIRNNLNFGLDFMPAC